MSRWLTVALILSFEQVCGDEHHREALRSEISLLKRQAATAVDELKSVTAQASAIEDLEKLIRKIHHEEITRLENRVRELKEEEHTLKEEIRRAKEHVNVLRRNEPPQLTEHDPLPHHQLKTSRQAPLTPIPTISSMKRQRYIEIHRSSKNNPN